MKKIFIIMLSLMLVFPAFVKAQDIQVKRFERNYTSLIARMNQANDNAGEACAVLRCYVRGNEYSIEPNLGIVKKEILDGEIRLWVPQGTKRITVRHKGLKPLIGYEIPIRVESKIDYDVDIEEVKWSVPNVQLNQKEHNVYIGAGYNIMSMSGLSAAIGFNKNRHQIELGAVYGFNKTDDLYFYDSSGNTTAGYQYSAIRADLKYGYEIPLSKEISLIPMGGLAYHTYMGKDIANLNNSDYKNASSLSFLAAVRLTVSLGSNFKLGITPEYDTAIYKDKTCKFVSSYDDNMKSWHSGFNLNLGLMVFF